MTSSVVYSSRKRSSGRGRSVTVQAKPAQDYKGKVSAYFRKLSTADAAMLAQQLELLAPILANPAGAAAAAGVKAFGGMGGGPWTSRRGATVSPHAAQQAAVQDARENTKAGGGGGGGGGGGADAAPPTKRGVHGGEDGVVAREDAVTGDKTIAPVYPDGPPPAAPTPPVPGGGVYGTRAAYNLMKGVGATDAEAANLAAISQPESSGKPWIVNDNPATGDLSYGLWQINMRGGLGPARRKQYGLKSNEDLKDPVTNAKIALDIARAAGNYRDWGAYRSGLHRRYMAEAERARADYVPGAGGGDFVGGGATGVYPDSDVDTAQDLSKQPQPVYPDGPPVLPMAVGGGVRETQKSAASVRKGALNEKLRGELEYASAKTGLTAVVTSGGQRMHGAEGATGSHRHDQGGSADLHLEDENGRTLDMNNPDDRVRMADFISHAVAAGVTGVGGAPNYMGTKTLHLGGGSATTWGKKGQPASPWVTEAWKKGRGMKRDAPTAGYKSRSSTLAGGAGSDKLRGGSLSDKLTVAHNVVSPSSGGFGGQVKTQLFEQGLDSAGLPPFTTEFVSQRGVLKDTGLATHVKGSRQRKSGSYPGSPKKK